MKKPLIILALAVLVLGVALPYAPIDFLKGPLEGALARGLGRKVEVDSVAFTLFSGPGFSLDGVIIHEDPRAAHRAICLRQHARRAPRPARAVARPPGIFQPESERRYV